jgi:hypothetical protein
VRWQSTEMTPNGRAVRENGGVNKNMSDFSVGRMAAWL